MRKEFSKLAGCNISDVHELGFYNIFYTITKPSMFSFEKSKITFDRCRIFIFRGLGTEISEEVLAHEIAHDFLDYLIPGYNIPLYYEGFAQFMATEYNRSVGRLQRNAIIFQSEDPIYGDGVRIVRDMYQRYGNLNSVIEEIRSTYRA